MLQSSLSGTHLQGAMEPEECQLDSPVSLHSVASNAALTDLGEPSPPPPVACGLPGTSSDEEMELATDSAGEESNCCLLADTTTPQALEASPGSFPSWRGPLPRAGFCGSSSGIVCLAGPAFPHVQGLGLLVRHPTHVAQPQPPNIAAAAVYGTLRVFSGTHTPCACLTLRNFRELPNQLFF